MYPRIPKTTVASSNKSVSTSIVDMSGHPLWGTTTPPLLVYQIYSIRRFLSKGSLDKAAQIAIMKVERALRISG